MKKSLFIISLTVLLVSSLFSDIQESLEKFGVENGKAYIKPFVTAYGTNFNTGLYNTAKVLKPFRFGLFINTMFTGIPDKDKDFLPSRPNLYIDDPLNPGEIIYLYEEPTEKTATVFGKDGCELIHNPMLDNIPGLDTSNLDYNLPDGTNLPAVLLMAPQFHLGLPAGNELMIRGFPKYKISKDIGDVGFWGIGLKHSISQYIPLVPIDLAVQGAYQSLYLGDILELNNLAFNAQISKKLLMWTFYAGMGYEQTKLKAEYETEIEVYDEVSNSFDSEALKIKFDIEGDNNFRTTFGIRYSLLLLKLYADYTLSDYNVFNAGIGISF
ncbi:MAG: hypothetical protein HQ534_08665 [Armatimonadetes bacterium]|nr:hypothetical protein [Armatimonadota bacterium]